jgi:hypothetical protein
MKQSFSQLSDPLPAEAVGVGARWETTLELDMGMEVTAVYDVQLEELTEDTARLSTRITQRAEPQSLPVPEGATDIESLLERFSSQGEGSSELDFSRMIPISAEAEVSGRMEAVMTQGNKKTPLETDIVVRLQLAGS